MLVVLLLFLIDKSFAEDLSYSFRVPPQWGALSIADANCCPRCHYATNQTTNELSLPHVIGLGVQKGGSTSVSQYMSRHSGYVESNPKETHFFDKDWKSRDLRNYHKSWGKRGQVGAIRFEFTPSYLWVPFSACRIKKSLPDMKFIVILRNPADRAYSEFDMVRTRCRGRGPICSWVHNDFLKYMQKGVRLLEQRGCTFRDGAGNKNWNDCFQCLIYNPRFRQHCQYRPYYMSINNFQNSCLFFGEQVVSRGLYAAQLSWWFQLFPPQNFIVLNSHEFFVDPVGELNRVNAFLGVEESFKEWMTHSQGMKGKYKFRDPHKEEAKAFLSEFYERPNKELYMLLDQVGLGPFKPFESYPKTISTASDGSVRPEIETGGELVLGGNTDTGEDEAPSEESEELESPSEQRSHSSSAIQRIGSSMFLIPNRTGIANKATQEATEAPEDSNLIVLGRDVSFHKKPFPESGFVFHAASRATVYFALTVLVIAVVLWIMQSSRQQLRLRQLPAVS